MNSAMKLTSLSVGLLLACGASPGARADIPTGYTLQDGTVLSTHTPETAACPITWWQLWIGPANSVRGKIWEEGTNKAWGVSGAFDSHGTFHLDDRGMGAVDAQVQSDGSLSLRMAKAGDQSACYNRTVYLPWFRNGNDFNPYLSGGEGSR
jgi:hypothetical protein